MLTKEEYSKKMKTKIKRTKVSVQSWMSGQDMVSKIKDIDIDLILVDNNCFFDITIKSIEICHETYNVNHHFLFSPNCNCAHIKECKYLEDDIYPFEYLSNINNYDMWKSHFRECMWCIIKALSKESSSVSYMSYILREELAKSNSPHHA